MKTIRLIALLIFLLPTACARLPEIYKPAVISAAAPAACERIFPQGHWQFVHRIDALPPDGSRHTFMGVIQLSSKAGTIHCVMMTVEGLVILEADYDGAVHILRAVPPMDRPGLAEGMIRDLQLIFFAPHQPVRQAGVLKDGERIYRYALADGGTEDLLIRADGRWTINRYNRRRQLTRTVRSDPKAPLSSLGFPSRLVLQAHGLLGYQMTLTLLDAQPLGDQRTSKG
jgi:hypothetical protein